MMRAAVIDETGVVVNVIVADPERDTLPDYILVAIPDGQAIDVRWAWSAETGFHPGSDLQAELDAHAAAIEQEGLAFDD